jgi:hypothetical protein
VNADTIISKGQQHVETLADGEVVLMHVESGRFFTLSGTGRRFWELLDKPMAIDALADRLTEEFEVGKAECVNDLLALCERLEARNLIDVAG